MPFANDIHLPLQSVKYCFLILALLGALGDSLLCTGLLDSEPGRQLMSVARASGPCLHRSPEFFAVPLAVSGWLFGVGKLCKAQLYEYPWRKDKAAGRS